VGKRRQKWFACSCASSPLPSLLFCYSDCTTDSLSLGNNHLVRPIPPSRLPPAATLVGTIATSPRTGRPYAHRALICGRQSLHSHQGATPYHARLFLSPAQPANLVDPPGLLPRFVFCPSRVHGAPAPYHDTPASSCPSPHLVAQFGYSPGGLGMHCLCHGTRLCPA
jgi:hypothetical protein